MKRLIFIGIFLLCVGVVYSYTLPYKADPESRIIQNLNYIENMYFKYLSPHERKEAIRIMNETKALIVGIVSGTAHYHNVMSDEAFFILYNSVKDEITDSTKTKIIQKSLANGKITCSQLEKLVALYTFDNRREELIKVIADRIIDPVNIEVVLQHFDSSVKRDQLRDFFSKIKPGN
jgi:hypothetical protein